MAVGNPFSRRGFLTVGAVGFGLTLGDFFRLKARADLKNYERDRRPRPSRSSTSSCPAAWPTRSRSTPSRSPRSSTAASMGTIKTKLDGVVFSEMLPKTAEIADKITVIRSMTHGEAAHERGTHNMFTGYRPSPALQFPSMGSVVSHEFGPRNNLPPYVCVPSMPNEYAGTGYLSSSFAPFSLGSDPANGGFKVQDLNLPGGVDDARFATPPHDARRGQRPLRREGEVGQRSAAMDTFYQRAYSLISSQQAREAFNIDAEPAALRDEYGRNAAGQRMLMARRLVEAGVRFVTLTYGGWDMHASITARHARASCPPFDQAFAALITRPRPHGPARQHAGHGLQRVRPHAEDQRHRRPRPLAEGVQRRAGRRRHQEGLDLRHVERDRQRAGGRRRSA